MSDAPLPPPVSSGQPDVAEPLALVIHALDSGGAERVLAGLAGSWAAAGRSVTLITLAAAGADRYPLHPSVHRVGLDLLQPSHTRWEAVRNNAMRLRQLRRAIRASGARRVLSFTDHMNVLTLLACWGGPWQVVIAERNDPRRQRMSGPWELLRRWSYPRCAAAVVQTEAVAQHVRRLTRGRPVHVIPNAIAAPRQRFAAPPSPPFIVAMGRLTEQKGFDLLIEAFARIDAQHPEWQLKIIGEGPDRQRLENLARERGVGQRVSLLGWLDDPQPVLQAAELFVLSSRWEGFPNALLEAMACGLPAISFDCPSGPADIIRHNADGLLVPAENVAALAAALDRLLADPPLRQKLGIRAREVTQRFNEPDILTRWNQALALPP